MKKTILITGSTDGIGLLAAQKLGAMGHAVLLHGRSPQKLERAQSQVPGSVETYCADLSQTKQVLGLVKDIHANHQSLDVLINNAGVLKLPQPMTEAGFDARFVVNTLAPFALTKALLPLIPTNGRVVNLSSAAQAPVNLEALAGKRRLDDMSAYAQSKLAITIWTQEMAALHSCGPLFVALNPGSLLASKMVKEGFGVPGKDLNIGADIMIEAALGDAFVDANGKYFDNDSGRFSPPHSAAQDAVHCAHVMEAIVAASAKHYGI